MCVMCMNCMTFMMLSIAPGGHMCDTTIRCIMCVIFHACEPSYLKDCRTHALNVLKIGMSFTAGSFKLLCCYGGCFSALCLLQQQSRSRPVAKQQEEYCHLNCLQNCLQNCL